MNKSQLCAREGEAIRLTDHPKKRTGPTHRIDCNKCAY